MNWGFNIHHFKSVLRLGEPGRFGRSQWGVVFLTKKLHSGYQPRNVGEGLSGIMSAKTGYSKLCNVFAAASTPNSLLKSCTSPPGNPVIMDDILIIDSRQPFSTNRESICPSIIQPVRCPSPQFLRWTSKTLRRTPTTDAKHACPKTCSPLLLTVALHLNSIFTVGEIVSYD